MYEDKITWYLNEENFNARTYQFFTRVIGCSDENTDYTTLEELNKYPLARKQQESPIYSVEFNEEGRLVLSLDFYSGRFVPTSIALISIGADNKQFMIAKIVTAGEKGSTQVSASVSRIFDIPIPKFKVGETYKYPSFETVYKRKSGTPIGEEKVMIGEHHHAVQTNGENDTYPSLYSGQDNFILSAKNALPLDITDSESYVYGERGNLSTDYTDLLGVKATQNSINITDRNISAMADILADVLEVIIMANNKIQILGKNIPDYPYDIPVKNSKQYILMADSIEQSNNRKLEAIDTERLKSWILGKHNVVSNASPVTLTSTISVIKSSIDFTISPNGSNKLAIVANTKSAVLKGDKSNLDDNDITVTLTGASADLTHKIHASSIKYFYFDGSTWEEYHDSFAYDTIYQLLSGEFKFDKLDVSNKITSTDFEASNLISTSSLKATGTSNLSNISGVDGEDITMTDAKLKFGESYISSDNSASFANGTSSIDTSGNISTTSGIEAPSIKNGTLSLSLLSDSNTVSVSGGLSVTGDMGSNNLTVSGKTISNSLEVTTSIEANTIKASGDTGGSIEAKSLEVSGKTKSNSLEVTTSTSTASLKSTTSNLGTITGIDSKDITLSSAKLEFNNSYISSDGSADFGSGTSKFGTDGVLTTTSNIQAPSIKNGTIGISMSSDTVSVSGKLAASSGSLTLSDITVDKIILGDGSIRYNSGFEFYNGNLSSWGNIKTSGVYIQ